MIKAEIIKKAKALGIDKVGFSRGAVVMLFPYFVEGEEGNISMYARGMDYHIVAEERLEEISKTLKEYGATKTEIHVDKGTLDDRLAAFSAGLGFYGMNGMLINPEYGSYFFIGQIVHDLEIEPDSPLLDECLMCGRCERECPGNALRGGVVDTKKCLSDITQRRGELSDGEKTLIKKTKSCWGCDVCQRVCPHNRGLRTTAMKEFMTDRIKTLKAEDIETLSNREFDEAYKKYAFSWRGKSVLLRNLKIYEEE